MFSATDTPRPFHGVTVRRRRRAGALLTAFATVLAIIVAPASHAVPGQPGTLDTTWATTGKLMSPIGTGEDRANALAVQPDGKVVVAGTCHNGSNNDFCLARYNVNGVLDTTFGNGGKVITDFSSGEDYTEDDATAIALQPDGKIVVAGSCFLYSLEFCLARYSANGALDATFGDGGTLISFITPVSDNAAALAIQPDGKIVMAGYCPDVFCLARYDASGVLDTTFGSGGIVFTDMSIYEDEARALALQPDGKIVVAGSCLASDAFCVARYAANGVLDATFGSGGTVVTNFGSTNGRALALQPDGKIVVAGECYTGKWDICLVRYSPNGVLDASFGSSGKVVTAIGTDASYIGGLALQPDGRIVVAGYCYNGSNNDFCLARYVSSGALDASFGSSGKVITAIGTGADVATAVALQRDGKIVVAGYCDNGSNKDFCVARYDGGPFETRNCSMDIDGDGVVLATTDALILARVSLGLSGNAVIGGITFAAHASRPTWADIRTYLVAQCGMSLVP